MRYTYRSGEPEQSGIGISGALVAVAAFGLGYYLGLRRFGEASVGQWVGEHARSGGISDYGESYRDASHIDDRHEEGWGRGGSRSRTASPPPAEVLIGDQLSGKSARESATVLYDQDGRPMRREQAHAGGHQ